MAGCHKADKGGTVKRHVLSGIVLAATLISSGATAQTCGTNLSCSTTATAFSVTNSNGPAIFGHSTLSTGTNYGVKGVTASSDNNAAGVLGIDGSGTVCTVSS